MTKNSKSNLAIFEEYKLGFEEIKKLVESFDDIYPDSQKVFLKERINIFEVQMETVNNQRLEVFNEVRSFLAKVNSKLKAIVDTERFLQDQIKECEEFNGLITDRGELKNEGE
jgi:hypothetical protein